jgi:hypothetical protein
MAKLRNPDKDKLKSPAILEQQYTYKHVCSLEGCGQPLTIFEGPGSDSLCRDHQLQSVEYGGYGKIDRPHTFHRADTCTCCGQDINDDPRWEKAQTFFGATLTESQKHEIKRRYNHGDHNGQRKSDGGSDSAENIVAFCSFCHWVKTVIFDDGRKGNKSLVTE